VVQTFPLRRRGKALALFFGFHQSPIWAWGNPAIAACIAAGGGRGRCHPAPALARGLLLEAAGLTFSVAVSSYG